MSVARCTYCHKTLIEWMSTKFGKRLPFEFDLRDRGQLPDGTVGWLPGRWQVGRTMNALVMAPVDHYSDHIQRVARKVAVLHRCPEYVASLADRPDLAVVS